MDRPIMSRDGIVDSARNPFIFPSWISQGNPFTLHRQKQFENAGLIGMSVENIQGIGKTNEGRYLAFVAIAWGFAKLVNDRLTATEKWLNRFNYDGYGHRI
jgi:hypothetical protein